VLWPTLKSRRQDMVGLVPQNLGTKYEVSPLPYLYQIMWATITIAMLHDEHEGRAGGDQVRD